MVGGVFLAIEVVQPGERASELLRQLDDAMPDVPIVAPNSGRVPVILRDAKSEEEAKATLEDGLDGLEGGAGWREVLRVRTSVEG